MQTDLGDARWNIQIVVDGIPAAQQTVAGTAAFVNGALISYPTNHDVSMVITLDGVVPAVANPAVMLWRAEEIDNGGNAVPISVLMISKPVLGLTTLLTATPTTTANAVSLSTPTNVPGFSAIAGIGALVTGWMAAGSHLPGKNRRNGK
jgi:hypothetical protein